MNETLSSSFWPNFPTSRQNLNEQLSLGAMNAWQQKTSSNDLYSPEDYNNVWSAKSDKKEDNEQESFIKSIWNTNANSSVTPLTDTSSLGSDSHKNTDETPTNSPSLKRTEIINCNDRWGSVKINQITPWKIVEIDESEETSYDPMVWRAKIDGTEVWEDYYVKQHGHRRPQTDSSFAGENVWSSASEITQSTNSIWPPSNTDTTAPVTDSYSQNLFTEINNRSNFNTTNGVRPSMTRNQAQKYLIDMGYSLSDAIGALVNNQMDLPKAINELKSKYRMPANTSQNVHNVLPYTPTMPFNNRATDNVNMTRIPPGTPINTMMGQNNSIMSPMMAPSFSNNYDLFHSTDANDQILESSYMNMDPNMGQYGRITEPKRQGSMPIMGRDSSYRNTFPNNVMNGISGGGGGGGGRIQSNSCGGQYGGDMNVLSQGMSRMNVNYNQGPATMMAQNPAPFNNNIKWPLGGGGNINGFTGLHNNHNNNNVGGGGNNTMMLNNNNANMDMRHGYGAATATSAFGRSISKQQIYQQCNPSALAWNNDLSSSSSSISTNGALNDLNPARLAKNMPDNVVGIIIRKVPSQQIDIIKSICFETGAVTNFQLQPHTQSILVHFNSVLEARRCVNIIQSQLSIRVDLVSDDYLHCMPGAN